MPYKQFHVETFHITKKEWGRIDRKMGSFSDMLVVGNWASREGKTDAKTGTIHYEYESENAIIEFLAIPGPRGHDGDYHITIRFIPV